MEDLTLSLDGDFWKVGIPLIDLLDNLAHQTEQTVDVNTPEKYLFGNENLAWGDVRKAHEQVVAQNTIVGLLNDEVTHLTELKKMYGLQAEETVLKQAKQQLQEIIQKDEPILTQMNSDLDAIDPDADRDEAAEKAYQDLIAERDKLKDDLDGNRQKLTNTESALGQFGDLQAAIDNKNKVLYETKTKLYTNWIPETMLAREVEHELEHILPEKQKRAKILLSNYEVEEATKTTEAKQVTAGRNKDRNKMRKKVAELKVFKQIAENNEDKAENEREKIDFHVLQKSLSEMAEVTPGVYQKLVQDVTQNFAAAELDKRREEVKQTLKDNFNDLKANESRNIRVQVDLGVGLSAVAGGARVTVSGVRTIGVSLDSFNQYTVTRGWDVAAGFMAFGGATVNEDLKAQLLGGTDVDFSNNTSSVYNSSDEMIDAEAGNISTTFLDFDLTKRNWRFLEKINNKQTQKEAVDHQKLAQSNWSRLQKNLRLVGILTEEQQVTIPQLKKVKYTTTSSVGLAGDAYGGATLRVGNHFGVGGSVELNGSYTTSYDSKTIHLIDDVVKEPTMGKIYTRRHPGYFGFTLTDANGQEKMYSGQEAIERLEEMEAQIDNLQKEAPQTDPEKLAKETKMQALRKQLTKALGKLSLDYQTFVLVENEVQRKTMGGQATLNKFRDTRGVKDSVSYLKAVSLQYANLKRAYDKTFAEDEVFNYDESKFSEQMQDFEKDLKTPPFKISNSDYAKAFDITEATGNNVTTTIGAELMLVTPRAIVETEEQTAQALTSGVRVGLKHSATTDPEGYETETMNINFNVPNDIGSFGTNFVANILNLTDIKKLLKPRSKEEPKDANDPDNSDPDSNDPATNDETPDADMGLIEEVLKEAVLRADGGNVEVQLYRKNKGYHIKYIRGYAASNKKIGGTGIIPVVPGMNIRLGGSVALNQKSLVYERPGDNTLSYLTTLYSNGQIQVNDNLPSYDEATGVVNYDKEHRLLDNMLKNLKNAESNISNELEVWFDEMKKYHSDDPDGPERSDFINEVKQKLAVFRAAPESDNNAENDFKEVFLKFVGKRTTDETNYYNQLFHTRRTTLAKDMRTYAGDLIVERVNKLITTYGIPNESANSIENMKKWAKKRYSDALKAKKDNESNEEAAQELQDSFEVLKSVFAVDYASQMLENLISSGDAADQNEALSLLDATQLDVLLKPQEKVYLDKGLTGRLEQGDDGTLKIKPIVAKGNKDILSDTTIARRVEEQMGGVEYTSLSAVEVNDNNQEVIRKQVKLNSIRQISSNMSDRLARSRSVRSAVNLLGDNRKTISDYIAQVMQKSLAQRRQAQAQAQKAKNAGGNK